MTTRPAFLLLFVREGLVHLRMAWVIAAMGLVAHICEAGEQSPDPDLPQPLSAEFADPLLNSSPFTRFLDLSSTLKLTGIAYLQGGQPVVTLVNTTTKKSYLVTTEPNELGWHLAGVIAASRIDRAEAKIVVGNETVSIRFSDQQLAPEKKSTLPQGIPTPAEFTGHDAKGAYVRVWPYMSDADRAKYLNRDLPKQVREEFLKLVHDQRDELFKVSHEERAAAVKKAFESTIGK